MMVSADNDTLLERSKRCVCKHCGSALEVRMVIFCQYGGQGLELYCPACERLEYGIDPEVYQLAKEFVENYEFNYYLDMAEGERNKQLNIAKVGEIIGWLLNRLALYDENGLQKELIIKSALAGNSL